MPARTGKKKSSKKTKSTYFETVTIPLHYLKSTKGTHVYADDREDAPIPSLYIRKAAFPAGDPPRVLTITLEQDRGFVGDGADSDDEDDE